MTHYNCRIAKALRQGSADCAIERLRKRRSQKHIPDPKYSIPYLFPAHFGKGLAAEFHPDAFGKTTQSDSPAVGFNSDTDP